MLCQAVALGLSPLLPLASMAQAVPASTGTAGTAINTGNTTILPTDVVPLADRESKTPIGELLQLKIMQRLPSRLYFSSSVEITGRNETNPFQFPTKRRLLADLPRPAIWRILNEQQQAGLYDIIGQVNRNNMVFRALPNVSGGWTLGPHTRLFTNYFMIRDQLAHSMRLNTVIHSYAVGLQHDVPVGAKGSLQFEFQGRELWQLHQQSVFDFLPGVTFSYIATPRTVLFVNALIQARGKAPFQAPTKEIDPFFTWGGLYQKNGWTFSASTTFVQNFREPFHSNATIPKNSYVMISDFEIARRVLKQYPGLQAFCRAEPIWNFHASNIPSLAGMDFRMFFGMRFAMAKPALTNTLQQIREQLKQEGEENPNSPTKPSAEIEPEHPIAQNPQPIHGFLESQTLAETCQLPEGEMPVIADEPGDPNSEPVGSIAQDNVSAPSQTQAASVVADSEGAAAAAPNNTKLSRDSETTLDSIAAKTSPVAPSSAENGAAPIAKVAMDQAQQSAILDLSSKQLDWKDFDSTPVLGATNPDELHDLVASASESSNSSALKARGEEIQKLAQKQEQEYKLAFAPPPVAFKPMAVVPAVAPAPKPVPSIKPAVAEAIKPTSTSLKPLPQVIETTKFAAKKTDSMIGSLPTLAPSGLAHNAAPAQPSSHPVMADIASVQAPSLKAPQLEPSKKILQPMERAKSELASNTPALLSDLKTASKLAQPVPLSSKSELTPNSIPAPVSAKITAPSGYVPALKTEKAKEESLIAASKPVQHLANKDGSIPISEAKLDTVAAKPTFNGTSNASKPATPVVEAIASKPVVSETSKATKPAVAPVETIATKAATSGTSIATKPAAPAVETIATKAVTGGTSIATKPAAPAVETIATKAVTSGTSIATKPAVAPVETVAAKTNNSAINSSKRNDVIASASVPQTGISASKNFSQTIKSAPAAVTVASKPRVELPKPVLPSIEQIRMEENANAVSGLDSDICSPKIAMAVYDNWKSPVLDDPLIGSDPNNTPPPSKTENASSKIAAKPPSKKAEKQPTDMRLIPPFPAANTNTKDNPLSDIAFPVLPMH